MAGVYLASTNAIDDRTDNLSRLKLSALAGAAPKHHVVMTPENADIILFSNSPSYSSQTDVWNHDLTKEFADKVFVYSTNDREFPFFPGVYTCAEKRWYVPSHMRSGFYIKVMDHDWIQSSPIKEKPLYLFSFCGAFTTHPLRTRIANLRGAGFIKDTSADEEGRLGTSAEKIQRWQAEYFRSMHDSIFVLCPRGAAPSSFRLFEAMKAGRVPVIISDAWVPPVGPNWSEFSLRVPEAHLEDVPRILESFSDRAQEMGLRASQAWERWFSNEQAFQTIVTWCLQILACRRNQGFIRRYRPLIQLARPFFFRHAVLPAAKSGIRKFIRKSGYDIVGFNPNRIGVDTRTMGVDPRTDMLRFLHHREPLILDVGADKGQEIRRFREKIPDCVIHSFEPNPTKFAVLQRHACVLKNVSLWNCTLGSTPRQKISENSNSNMSVAVTTLDQFCHDHGIEFIDILKIDRQDLELLQGAKKTIQLKKIGLIYFEVGLCNKHSNLPSFADMYEFLTSRRFLFNSTYNYFFEAEHYGGRLPARMGVLFVHRSYLRSPHEPPALIRKGTAAPSASVR